MKNEQLAREIVRELVRDADETLLDDRFRYWHARYYGYRFPSCNYAALEDATKQLTRLRECFDEEEFRKLIDESEERYRATIDPEVWALYKNKAEPAVSPVAIDDGSACDDFDDLAF